MDKYLYNLLWTLLVIILCHYLVDVVKIWKSAKKYPLGGGLSVLIPRFVLNIRFAVGASSLIRDSYRKYKDRAIQFIRCDGSIFVLPYDVLDELSALPPTVAGPSAGIEKDLMGKYTGINMIMENRLHHSTIQRRLTQRLSALLPSLEKEITLAFKEIFPPVDDWTSITPYELFGKIAPRVNASVLVGAPLCRDPKWIEIAVNYTEQIMQTTLILRIFPHFMHSIVVRLLPSYWKGRNCIRKAEKILLPTIQKFMDANNSRTQDQPASTKEDADSTLSWLAQSIDHREHNSITIVHAQILLAFASTHTTLTRVVNALYDIIAVKGTLAEDLVAEIESVALGTNGWHEMPYDRLYKLDSMLRESQRTSPTVLLGMKRVFQQPYTFQNGIHVPKGSYTAMLVSEIENDPIHIPNPEVFDPMRCYREKQALGLESAASKEFDFSAATRTALGFGYGRAACPGRFFGSLVIKMIFTKLLTEYEFRFLQGQGRPRVINVHDYLVTSPTYKIQVRRKPGGVCPY
ncbi:cytochrome P450 [Xylaria nigripes]|nr:cytochrome P450 [Xylaria nigripes]